MRGPRRLVAALAATALCWSPLALLTAPAAEADTGNRAPQDPATYYAGTEGLAGSALALKLNSIIDGHTRIPYTSGSTDVWDAMEVLDRDPLDASRVIDVYSGDSLAASNKCGSSCPNGDSWNREHVWSQSRGSFDTDPGPGTDLFHMRVSRGNTNSSRGNLDFDETVGGPVPGCPTVCQRDSDSFEPRQDIKGDVARGLFYMDVRYNGDADDEFGVDLRMWDQTGNSGSQLGKLSTLVAWSLADPPDEAERARNDLVDSLYQHNRNPFIDRPEWVCSIWGTSNPTACSATNQPPTITSATTRSTPRDTPFSLPLTATDPNGDPLTWTLVAPAAAYGSASLTGTAPNVALSYTPAAGYSGPDAVGIRVSDGKGGVATATVQITVTAVNRPPVVEDVGADDPVAVPRFNRKQITLLGDDPDGDPLSYAIVAPPGRGTVSINGNVATYSTTSASGLDGFTYRAVDPAGLQSEPGQVTVTIQSSPHPPDVTPVSATTPEDEPTAVALTASDPDGDLVTFAVTTPPTKGTISLAGDEVTYTPNPNAHGADAFGWSASDGTSTVSSSASITITPVDDAPVASPVSTSTPEDTPQQVTLTSTDVDGPAPTYAIASQPTHGSVTLTGVTATYTPDPDYHGPDSFTFTATGGTTTSAPATVALTVSPVNDAPTATAITGVTTPEDTTKVIPLNGADVDQGDTLTFGVGVQPAHGSVSVTGSEATYTPAANYAGDDTFQWTVSDGTVTISRTATITVTPIADAPVATPGSTTTAEDTAKVITLSGSDPDGDTVTYGLAATPSHGTVTLTGDQATYTPSANHHGPDSFTFTVSDGTTTSAPATVAITVTPVNDVPTAAGLVVSGDEDGDLLILLSGSDVDEDPLSFAVGTPPAHGVVVVSGSMATYTPDPTSAGPTASPTSRRTASPPRRPRW